MVSAAITGMTSPPITLGTGGNSNLKINAGFTFDKIISRSFSNGVDNSMKETSDKDVKAKEVALKEDDTIKDSKVTENKAVKEDSSDKTDNKEAVTEAVDELKSTVKEKLSITDEQLSEAMNLLGMTAMDLLDPKKLTELVASFLGDGDTLSFITDADMMITLNDILEVLDNVTNNLAQTLEINPDELASTIAELDIPQEEVTLDLAKDEQPDLIEKAEVSDSDTELLNDFDGDLENAVASKLVVKTFADSSNAKEGFMKESGQNTTFEQVVNNFSEGIKEAFAEVITDNVNMVSEADIVRQVVEQIKLNSNTTLQSIEVVLNPANLGNVHVTVSAKEGVITAQLTAQNEQVKAALENQVVALKEHFNNQGIKVDAIEVTVQSHSFESNENLKGNDSNQADEKKKASRKLDISSIEDFEEDELTDSEIRARDAVLNGNSSVEYSA